MRRRLAVGPLVAGLAVAGLLGTLTTGAIALAVMSERPATTLRDLKWFTPYAPDDIELFVTPDGALDVLRRREGHAVVYEVRVYGADPAGQDVAALPAWVGRPVLDADTGGRELGVATQAAGWPWVTIARVWALATPERVGHRVAGSGFWASSAGWAAGWFVLLAAARHARVRQAARRAGSTRRDALRSGDG